MRMWAHAHHAVTHQAFLVGTRQETHERLLWTIAGLILALVAMIVMVMIIYGAMVFGSREIINLFDGPRVKFLWGIPV